MSESNDRPPEDVDDSDNPGRSVSNPFAVGDEVDGEKPQLNLSPRRAAVLGLYFGLVMVGLLLICFLGSAALTTCSGT